MFGVYFHIPFCRKACSYCNFHFSTNLNGTGKMAEAISKEIGLTNLPEKGMKTLYFGGGTPSLLQKEELGLIFSSLRSKTEFSELEEVTLECNPEDINVHSLEYWKNLGITRLSIGLQSLNESELRAMNRAHNDAQSFECLDLLGQFGYFNISVDLIYGTPWKSNSQWEEELDFIIGHKAISHISAYALTVESKTQLNHQINKGEIPPIDDDRTVSQFNILQEKIHQNNWEAYEISNYCKPNHRAKHNSQYWKFRPYFGFGPAAHSFDGKTTRYLNIANNTLYIQSIQKEELPREYEELSLTDSLNERIMTGLRTCEGIRTVDLENFKPGWEKRNIRALNRYIKSGDLVQLKHGYQLTHSGKLISDRIISDLMEID